MGIGAASGITIAIVLSLLAGVFGDLFSIGGTSAVSGEFNWRTVGRHVWTLGQVFAPVGIVLGALLAA